MAVIEKYEVNLPGETGRYIYRGYAFIHYEDGTLDMQTPEYYEIGIVDRDINAGLKLEDELLAGIIDYYDFGNRDLDTHPVEKNEIAQINSSFSKEEIQKYFPEIEPHTSTN